MLISLFQTNHLCESKYYFNRLTAAQKKIYIKIYRKTNIVSPAVILPLIPMNELSMIFNFVLYDNPLLFYVSGFHTETDLYKKQITLTPDYKYNRRFVSESITAIHQYLQIFDSAKQWPDIEKEIFIHDYCLNNLSYDYSFSEYAYSILGPVFNRQAVCEGIASFVKLACDYIGLKSLVVIGRGIYPSHNSMTDMAHAWNIIEVDGIICHLDITYDLTLKERSNRYDYFNLSDSEIMKDHIIGIETPPCVTNGNDYYTRNGLLAYNPQELDKIISNMLMHGQRNFSVKLMNVQAKDEIVCRVMTAAQKQYGMIYKSTAIIEVNPNLTQMVFEICFT